MTTTIAAIAPSLLESAVEATTPVVFVDGVPEPALEVEQFAASLPVDERRAVLRVMDHAKAVSHWQGRDIVLAVPHQLCDGESRWQVLLSGMVGEQADALSGGTDRQAFIVEDAWSALVKAPLNTLVTHSDTGLLLGELIDRLGSLVSAEIVWACPKACARLELSAPLSRGTPILLVLEQAFADAGLWLKLSLCFDQGRAIRVLTVLPERVGREVALPWPTHAGCGGAVKQVDTSVERHPPRAWVAEGARPIVEDTFNLVAGWDPALAGEPDAAYGRLTSSDFSRYGAVFRVWVLNEDGAYTGVPFDQGPAFDVGALFDAPGSIQETLRFGACLTLDASGRRLAPVIESSLDSGISWSAHPGQSELMQDHAGVVLTDDVLPAAVLSAAQAGTLRLRVTASLTSPRPVRAMRWSGNPFAGAGPTRRLSLEGDYAWRRVADTSIHANAIGNGLLGADIADDRVLLRSALQQAVRDSPGAEASATVVLSGAWSSLRVGDCARAVAHPDRTIDGSPICFHPRKARIRRLTIDFGVASNRPRTRLQFD